MPPVQAQSATNSVTIFGDPTVAGLAADTVFGFTVTTANNAFGCNDPATQVSATGSITIAIEPSITLTSGSNNLTICRSETISSTQGGVDIEWDISGFALDVFESEPVNETFLSKITNEMNCILTPHNAGVTEESNERVSKFIIKKTNEFLQNFKD